MSERIGHVVGTEAGRRTRGTGEVSAAHQRAGSEPSRQLGATTARYLEAFLADLLARRSASTAATRHKVLRILYRWLEEEDEVEQNPMARVEPPIVPEQPVPIVPEEGLPRLLAAGAGKTFDARRDSAIVMFLLDTGARRAELAGLRVADLDLDLDVALVLGKGRRERALPFGRNTAVALDRYLRVRARHKLAGLPWLWPGRAGPLTAYAVRQIVRRGGAHVSR
jgi:site-specific recombinase XerD